MASVYKRKIYGPVPPGAEIVQDGNQRFALWIGETGRRRKALVEASRNGGDRIVLGEADKYTIAYDTPRGRRTVIGYTDHDASVAKGKKLEQQAARQAEGLTDQFEEHRKTAIDQHLADFIDTRPSRATSASYAAQFRRRIERVLSGINARRIDDLDPVKIERFFTQEEIAGHYRNGHVADIKAFARWLVQTKRVREDPLASLAKTSGKKIDPMHPRRAISLVEIGRLLEAAVKRPAMELLTIRRGKYKGQQRAKIRQGVLDQANALGQERRLVYLIAFWAGLRRSEIRALCWGDIFLDAPVPQIRLRARTTKSKRGDVISLHPQLVESLRAAKPAKAKATDRVVRTVPDMKTYCADLELARIPYRDERGEFFDLHALRKALGTTMAEHKMSQRSRQAHMRHTDPRLTENTYMDVSLLPVAEELRKLPAIPGSSKMTAPMTARTALMQRQSGSGWRGVTRGGITMTLGLLKITVGDVERYLTEIKGVGPEEASNDKARHPVAPGLDQERVKGLEPSTFTLARGLETIVKVLHYQELTHNPGDDDSANDSAQIHDNTGLPYDTETHTHEASLADLPVEARMGMLAGLALIGGDWRD